MSKAVAYLPGRVHGPRQRQDGASPMQHMDASPIARRSRVADVDVRAIRTRVRMTQQRFADVFGLPVSNVRDWEQGRSAPDQAAQVLLQVIEHRPDAVRDTFARYG